MEGSEDITNFLDSELYKRQSEDRRMFYTDVEELLEHGFLTHTCKIKGVPVVFRNALPKDNKRIQSTTALSNETEFMAYCLASQTWIIDGLEIDAYNNTESTYYLFKHFYSKLHRSYLLKLYFIIIGLRNRLYRAIRIVEAYSCEPYSRSKWIMGHNLFPEDNCSLAYKLWVAFNTYEDIRTQELRQWEHTKVVSGSMSGKAFKELGKMITKMEQNHLQKNKDIIEKTVNVLIYGEQVIPQETLKVTYNGQQFNVPTTVGVQSVDQMVEEMKMVMRGEQDYHDMVMADYHEKIRLYREQQEKHRQQKLKELYEQQGEALEGETDLTGLTPEQIKQRQSGRTTGVLHDSSKNYLYDKYVAPKVVVGVLGQKGPERATTHNTPHPIQTKPNIAEDLQSQVNSRKPQIK